MKIAVVIPTRTGKWWHGLMTPRKLAYWRHRHHKWWNKRGRLLHMLNPEWWAE